jgi:hypothetical protein
MTSTVDFTTNCYGYNSSNLVLYCFASLCNTIYEELEIGDYMNLTSKTPKIELVLHPQEVLTLDNGQPVAVECRTGALWITCAGDNNDHVLNVGNRYVPKTKGSIVIQSLGESRVDIIENN